MRLSTNKKYLLSKLHCILLTNSINLYCKCCNDKCDNGNKNKINTKSKITNNNKTQDDENKKQNTEDNKNDNELSNLNKINSEINKKISKNNEEDAKQIIINKKNTILNLFTEVENLIYKIDEIIYNKYKVSYEKKQIEDENNIENLNKIETGLNKQKEKLSNLLKKITTDTPICKDIDEFITKFNERKNILADRFNDELKNKLKSNDLTKKNIDDYYDMYTKMTNDIFNHEISLDLQIYRYILKLEGFIDALNNIIKKDKIQYDFFTNFDGSNTNDITEIYKKNNDYFLEYEYNTINKNSYNKFRTIYHGIFYCENEPFKYVRCQEECKNGTNCISCKLRNLLNNEDIRKEYQEIYYNYGSSANKGDTVREFIYNHIKSQYKKKQNFRRIFSLKNYEEKENRKEKKSLMIEWALTIEFMKIFIPKFTCKNDFFLYRSLALPKDKKEKDISLQQQVDSTSLFGVTYFDFHNDKKDIYFTKIKAKYYCCFFNYIINPFPTKYRYKKKYDKFFLSTKLKKDQECEIGYIPINQKYEIDLIHDKSESEDFIKYSYEKSIENFKLNMSNVPNAKLHVFYENNEIKDI